MIVLRRTRSALVAALAVTALGLAAPGAHAQEDDYPGTTVPPVCTETVTASAPLLPNAEAIITGTCDQLPDDVSASGVLQSTPIALPAVTIAGHAASYPVKLPADWETKAFHTLNITRAADGVLLFSGRFYVDGAGKITAAPKGSDLPRTGASSTEGLAKGGVVLLAAGAAAVLVARKRRSTTPAA